jgi:uncharacterized protein YutE (UPF0331/DUF86 family)
MEKERLIVFLSRFEKTNEIILDIYDNLTQKVQQLSKEPVSVESVESAGYWMHNLYCAYEDLFRLVAAFFENTIKSDGLFHKQLLRTMTLTIPGIRPSVISEMSFKYLDELRGFRHVFRHAYSYGLDDERVIFLLRRIIKQKESILSDLKLFKDNITDSI